MTAIQKYRDKYAPVEKALRGVRTPAGSKGYKMTNLYGKFKTFYPCPEYTQDRDALIPEAERIADQVVGSRLKFLGPKQYYARKQANIAWGADWNLVFSREMDRLAREAGLVE